MNNLIIDVGNSRVKVAVFQDGNLMSVETYKNQHLEKKMIEIQKLYKIESAIISSVNDIVEFDRLKEDVSDIFFLNESTSIPFKNLYETPSTLGVDRIALVAAAVHKYPNQNTLIIDVGTCITYDFVNKKNEYLGGAISPGIWIRYKGMHDYTDQLPLLDKIDDHIGLIGASTQTSIESGVLNGIVFEIAGTIQAYEDKYGGLNIVLTGGDANFLCKQLKNSIFVNPNFLLEGLNYILAYQVKE